MLVGLVGCGVWGANVLRDLRLLGCDVKVVARSETSVARARAGGATAVVSSVEELGGIDGIVVVTPIATHAAVLEDALRHEVPVFVEKPLCDDASAAARLAEAAPQQLFVMDKWRYHPGVAALEMIAERGGLGPARGLRTVRVQPDNRHDEDAVWVLAPHDLAIALEIFGEMPQPVAAKGHWADGHLVTLHALLDIGDAWHAMEISERAPAVERRIELHCDDGLAVLAGGRCPGALIGSRGGPRLRVGVGAGASGPRARGVFRRARRALPRTNRAARAGAQRLRHGARRGGARRREDGRLRGL